MSVRVVELRVVHRRAANSAADKHRRNCLETAHDEMRGFRPQLANPANQKIVHLRIVLRAGIA